MPETEPASGKDKLRLYRMPHLVLDGAVLAAIQQPEFVARGDGLLGDGAADHARAADEENFQDGCRMTGHGEPSGLRPRAPSPAGHTN